jgi:hypothetical protein
MNQEATEITLLVIQALEKFQIPYLIAGSLASSLYGLSRSTLDTDLLADIKPEHVSKLYQEMKEQFYITEEEIHHAIRNRSSFNVIHFETVFKTDLFIPKNRRFDLLQFQNRRLIVVARNPDRTAYVAGAEDTILAKLEWYKLGNEISDRQWQDIIGVIRIQANQLDLSYLNHIAQELDLVELLARALEAL